MSLSFFLFKRLTKGKKKSIGSADFYPRPTRTVEWITIRLLTLGFFPSFSRPLIPSRERENCTVVLLSVVVDEKMSIKIVESLSKEIVAQLFKDH
jgi:hypothetical protein